MTSAEEPAAIWIAAPSWRRGLAGLIDAVPLLTLWFVAAHAIAAASPEPVPDVPWNLLDQLVDYIHARPTVVMTSAGLLLFLLFAVPLALQVFFGTTLGGWVLGLRVVDARGERPTHGRLTTHCAARVVSLVVCFGGILWALADPSRRTLHDRIAGVFVVLRPHP